MAAKDGEIRRCVICAVDRVLRVAKAQLVATLTAELLLFAERRAKQEIKRELRVLVEELRRRPRALAAKRRNYVSKSRQPIPRPLAKAVKAGVFGTNDAGKPIHPTPEEVRVISEQHAEEIIRLLNARCAIQRRCTAPQCSDRASVGAAATKLNAQIQAAIDQYAASFGRPAAAQLERYCRGQLAEQSR